MVPRRILAIKLRALGDTVILTASLRALREAFPEAQIDAVIPEAYAEVLRGAPVGVIGWPARGMRKLALLASLRARDYDWVINFHASPSSAWLARWCGGRARAVHFHGHRDANRFSTVNIPGKGAVKPIIERDLDCLRALGVNPARGETGIERNPVAARGNLLLLSPGASRETKRWPLERFMEVAKRWPGRAVFLLGPAERDFASQISDEKVVAPSLRETIDLIASARVFVGNDSGPKHIAVALGVPTFTLFGPEDPFEWHPYPRDRHRVFFREGLACRVSGDPGQPPWCGIPVCVQEGHRCMKEITVDDVLAEILPLAQPASRA